MIKGTRAVASDVSRYRKTDTGTAGKPQSKKSLMKQTRVESGGVTNHPVKGKPASSRMKGTRETSSKAGK